MKTSARSAERFGFGSIIFNESGICKAETLINKDEFKYHSFQTKSEDKSESRSWMLGQVFFFFIFICPLSAVTRQWYGKQLSPVWTLHPITTLPLHWGTHVNGIQIHPWMERQMFSLAERWKEKGGGGGRGARCKRRRDDLIRQCFLKLALNTPSCAHAHRWTSEAVAGSGGYDCAHGE